MGEHCLGGIRGLKDSSQFHRIPDSGAAGSADAGNGVCRSGLRRTSVG